jgi:tight adherence protein B
VVINVAVFALILAIILGGYWLVVLRPEEQQHQSLTNRLRTGPSHRLIERSGLRVNVGTIVVACVVCAFMTLALVVRLLPLPSILYAVPFAVAAASIPIFYLRWAAERRLETFAERFPDAIHLMARVLHAGHPLTTAFQMVGEDIPDPVGPEFTLVGDQLNDGMSLPEALKGMTSRIPLLDVRMFVTALVTSRETGGSLSDVLDTIASVIRERFESKREVRVISAHGRITGWVLGLLPPAMAVILFILSPSHILMLRDDPLGADIRLGTFLTLVGFSGFLTWLKFDGWFAGQTLPAALITIAVWTFVLTTILGR